ncbi:hypothetical protein ACOZ38_19970 [Sphaerisporangium viridialbum]
MTRKLDMNAEDHHTPSPAESILGQVQPGPYDPGAVAAYETAMSL